MNNDQISKILIVILLFSLAFNIIWLRDNVVNKVKKVKPPSPLTITPTDSVIKNQRRIANLEFEVIELRESIANVKGMVNIAIVKGLIQELTRIEIEADMTDEDRELIMEGFEQTLKPLQ
jgi:hypothetical protein